MNSGRDGRIKPDTMKIKLSNNVACVAGNWTLTGVTQGAIKSLVANLNQLDHLGERPLKVDCRQISAIDASGQQLLAVWLQCARLRGIVPELVNAPPELQQYLTTLEPGRSHKHSHPAPEVQHYAFKTKGEGKVLYEN